MRMGKVYFRDKFAGIIYEDDEGVHFKYDEEYLNQDKSKPVSLTLPLTNKIYSNKTMLPFFDGLIPEGWLLNIAEQNWKVNPRDRMGLLLVFCEDCIGAVSVVKDKDQ